MQDADMESLKYDSATYADLVASQLQEERYATWVVDTENPSEKGMPWQGGFLYLFFFLVDFWTQTKSLVHRGIAVRLHVRWILFPMVIFSWVSMVVFQFLG